MFYCEWLRMYCVCYCILLRYIRHFFFQISILKFNARNLNILCALTFDPKYAFPIYIYIKKRHMYIKWLRVSITDNCIIFCHSYLFVNNIYIILINKYLNCYFLTFNKFKDYFTENCFFSIDWTEKDKTFK